MTRGLIRAVLVGLLLTGCASGLEQQFCFDSSQCGPGQQCNFGVCTDAAGTVDLEVTPLQSSGFAPLVVKGLDLGVDDALIVTVPASIELQLRSPVEADVRFSADAESGRPLTYLAEVRFRDASGLATGQVALPRGVREAGSFVPHSYNVVAKPLTADCNCGQSAGLDPCVAPVIQAGVIPTTNTEYWLPFDVERQAAKVLGQIMVDDASWSPSENLQIQVFDPQTGVFSLPDVTNQDGEFCVLVEPPPAGGSHDLTLVMGPSETRPTVIAQGILIDQPDLNDIGVLFIGAHGNPVAIPGSVLDPSGKPVSGARVTFVGQVDPKGTFEHTTTTDDSGLFRAYVLRGNYVVVVSTPTDSPYATTTLLGYEVVDDPTAPAGPLDLVTPARPVLRGRVMGPNLATEEMEPIAGVRVIAVPDLGVGLQGEFLVRFESETDEAGDYLLPVDPGLYRLDFRPPQPTGLPWSVGRVTVSATIDQEVPLQQLESPLRLEGLCLGQPEGEPTTPLGGASVELLSRAGGERVPIYSALTDPDGSFVVILPKSIAPTSQ